jgi:hypothetical protein
MSEQFHQKKYCKCGEHCQCGDKLRHEHHEEHCHCEEKFLKLADEAWMEILKEKIKAEVEKKQGESLGKLAEIIAQANCEKWKHKITIKSKCEEYKSTLREFFSSKY